MRQAKEKPGNWPVLFCLNAPATKTIKSFIFSSQFETSWLCANDGDKLRALLLRLKGHEGHLLRQFVSRFYGYFKGSHPCAQGSVDNKANVKANMAQHSFQGLDLLLETVQEFEPLRQSHDLPATLITFFFLNDGFLGEPGFSYI